MHYLVLALINQGEISCSAELLAFVSNWQQGGNGGGLELMGSVGGARLKPFQLEILNLTRDTKLSQLDALVSCSSAVIVVG